MSEHPNATWARLAAAHRLIDQGQPKAAIEQLRTILGEDPDLAEAHALLAHALVDDDRIYAAEREAGLALAASPEGAQGHLAMARVLFAQRKPAEALEAVERARAMEADDPTAFRLAAMVHLAMGQPALARTELEKAYELDPESLETRAELGELAFHDRRLDEGERWAREVLEVDAEHVAALILMGRILLRRGDATGAREHAVAALRENPTHPGALHLLASIKSRQSWFLGLWWHWNTRISELGGARMIVALMAMYILTGLARLILEDTGHERAAEIVGYVWIGFCLYTWVAPSIFRRMLERELESVLLSDEF